MRNGIMRITPSGGCELVVLKVLNEDEREESGKRGTAGVERVNYHELGN